MTDIRVALKQAYGPEWHLQTERSLGSLTLGELAQIPATVYHGTISDLTGGWDIRKKQKAKVSGFAHITGGGQKSKLKTMLGDAATRLGITIDNPIEPPALLVHVQRLAGFSDEKAYEFHMGPGGVIATPEPQKVLSHLHESGLEGAKVIGQITDEPGIRLKNKGAKQDEEWLYF
jgi:phosphoribosylaminoimidazole (AIR) synthetase